MDCTARIPGIASECSAGANPLTPQSDRWSKRRSGRRSHAPGAFPRRFGSSEKLLHVTNLLYKKGIFVQIRWTHCNKTNNIHCCQYPALVRILPEDLHKTKLWVSQIWSTAATDQHRHMRIVGSGHGSLEASKRSRNPQWRLANRSGPCPAGIGTPIPDGNWILVFRPCAAHSGGEDHQPAEWQRPLQTPTVATGRGSGGSLASERWVRDA